jgi:hypothetical protein
VLARSAMLLGTFSRTICPVPGHSRHRGERARRDVPLAEVNVPYIEVVGIREFDVPLGVLGYGGWVGGRQPRTVCCNGGPVSPAVGPVPPTRMFFPYLLILWAAPARDRLSPPLYSTAQERIGVRRRVASHPKPRTRNTPNHGRSGLARSGQSCIDCAM